MGDFVWFCIAVEKFMGEYECVEELGSFERSGVERRFIGDNGWIEWWISEETEL